MSQKKSMSPPTKLRVLNLTYQIKYVGDTEGVAANADGWCDASNLTIVLCKSLPKESMADTFLHECLHAIGHSMDINWRKEEVVARRVATGLCTLWKQNPAAFRWWSSLL
jgi:hypothetical protein